MEYMELDLGKVSRIQIGREQNGGHSEKVNRWTKFRKAGIGTHA